MSLGITVCHHSASLVMPIGDPRDGYFYPTLTLMIDSYYLYVGSAISQSSSGTAKSTDTELTEIVETDKDGNIVKTSKLTSEDSCDTRYAGIDDWTDYTSESELDPTDDEEEIMIQKRPVRL